MTNNMNIPAYIKLKYSKKCSTCNEVIPVGGLAFWHSATKAAYHGKCGPQFWKVAGTPYAIRQSAAIKYQQAQQADKVNETTLESLEPEDPRKL